MLTQTKMICISLCMVNLSACMTSGQHDYVSNQPYDYQATPLYPEGYENTVVYTTDSYNTPQGMQTPNNYPVTTKQSPVASKDMDKAWVTSQSPTGYTIQMSENEKASYVARALQKAPKNERMAEVKYKQNGKDYYKGLYGSFPDAESATKALEALPGDIKQAARIETWGTVQQSLVE